MVKRGRDSLSEQLDPDSYLDIYEAHPTDNTLVSKENPYKYDFVSLSDHYPVLKRHMILNLKWTPELPSSARYHFDFSHPDAVYHLSKSILKQNHNLNFYLPCGCTTKESCNMNEKLDTCNKKYKETWKSMFSRFLSPCVPNRISYLRSISGLLSIENNDSELAILEQKGTVDSVFKGKQVVVLDIGTGASCIYPLLGVSEYSWRFIGTEVDHMALEMAEKNIELNGLEEQIELRCQQVRTLIFTNILYSYEFTALTVCNPPFHESLDKTNLNPRTAPTGTESELVFDFKQKLSQTLSQSYINSSEEGISTSIKGSINHILYKPDRGESGFIQIMMMESKFYCHNVLWFTSLVARLKTMRKIKGMIQEEMRMYNMDHIKQKHFLNIKLDGLRNKCSKLSFTPGEYEKIDVSQIHICEFRTFTIKLGKQTRWIIAWTYYNSQQRILIINKLKKLNQHTNNTTN